MTRQHNAQPSDEGQKECRSSFHRGPRLLPRTEFWRRSWSRDGLQPYCKACRRAEFRERYRKERDAMLLRNKRYRMTMNCRHAAEVAERHKEEKRQRRLEDRLQRAELVLDLVAQEYGYERTQLRGGKRGLPGLDEAKGMAVRLVRRFTKLEPEQIGYLLGCTPQTVQRRLDEARRWTRPNSGDVRVLERMQRLVSRYRAQVPAVAAKSRRAQQAVFPPEAV